MSHLLALKKGDSFKRIIGLICIAVIVTAMTALITLRINQKNSNSERAKIYKLKTNYKGTRESILAWWRTRNFTPIRSRELSDAISSGVGIRSIPPAIVDETLERESRNALNRFLNAFVSGRFEDYELFCSPARESPPNLKITASIRSKLIKNGSLQASGATTNAHEIRKLYWTHSSSRTDGKARFENYIEGVAIADSEIAIYRFIEFPAIVRLVEMTTTARKSLGVMALRNSYDITPEPQSVATDQGYIDLMEIALVFSPRSPDFPHAASVWHYWEPISQKWIPHTFINLGGFPRPIAPIF